MTIFAWTGTIVAMMIGFWLGWRCAKRLIKQHNPANQFMRVGIGACVATAALLFFQLNLMLAQTGIAFLTYPRFEAEIIAVSSKTRTEQKTDNNGRRYSMTKTVYVPTFAFTDSLGDDLVVTMETGSSERPDVGMIRQIAYKDGHMIEISGDTLIGTAAGYVFALCLGAFLIFIWAWGRPARPTISV